MKTFKNFYEDVRKMPDGGYGVLMQMYLKMVKSNEMENIKKN